MVAQVQPTTKNEIITWQDSTGNVLNLGWLVADNDLAAIWGRKGAYMPPAIFARYQTPFQNGSLVTFLRYDARQIDITCELFCDDITLLRDRMTAILQAFRPDKGDGVLSVTNERGVTRQIPCHYLKGLEGDEGREWGLGFAGRFILVFEAPSPFWQSPLDATAQTITIPASSGGASFTTAPVTITNAGNVEGWPVWTFNLVPKTTITNPQAGVTYTGIQNAWQILVTLTNQTTGDHFTFFLNGGAPNVTGVHAPVTYSGTDFTRVVNATPGMEIITDGVTPVPSTMAFQNFFPLAQGANSITVTVTIPAARSTGGGSPITQTFDTNAGSVSVVYKPQFLGL